MKMPWTDDLAPETLEALPEEITSNETLKNFDSLEALAKGFIETKSMVGQSIRIPPEEAGPEARNEFLNKLINNAPELIMKPDLSEAEQSEEFYRTMGKPEEFSKYENPEDKELNPEVEAELREVLFNADLTNAQYKKVMAAFADRQKQADEMNAELREGDINSLKGKWGMVTEERMAAAKKINDQFFPNRDFDKLTMGEVEGLFDVSKSFTGKGPQAATQISTESEGMTPQEAERRGEEIMKRIMTDTDMNMDEKHKLMEKRLKILTEFGGYNDSIDSMRASGL
jgi:hypothetical protein